MAAADFCNSLMQMPQVLFMPDTKRENYFNKVEAAFHVMEKGLCYVNEWFKEQLPVENQSGMSLEITWNNSVSLGGYSDTPGEYPKDYYGVAPGLKVLVFPDSYGYADGILESGRRWGRVAEKEVVKKNIAKIEAEHIKEFLSPGWDIIIFACGIDTPEDNTVEKVLAHQNAVTRLYLLLLQGIMKNVKSTKKLVCITCDSFADETEIHEEVGVGLITCANLFGLSNSARLELEFPVHFIDTEWALRDESVPMLASEVFRESSFGKNTVRILNSGRYILRMLPSDPYESASNAFRVPDKGIIAMTGGNGALAMVIGRWLLHQAAAQSAANKARGRPAVSFVLKFLSRSAKIPDDNMAGWETIKKLAESTGITVEQCRCDIGSRQSVNAFIEECTPNLAGFIHGAGVLQDSLIFTQTWEKYETVFDPKSRAALYLHDALERYDNPGLEFLWLYSSTAVYGNQGATNYSSANSYLDALARHRRAMGKPACSIQWSSWAEAGMAANLTGFARDRIFMGPQPPFSNVEGCQGLVTGLRTGLPYFAVLKWNPSFLMGMTFPPMPPDTLTPTAEHQRNFTAHIAPLPPEEITGDQDIHLKYCDALGLGENLVYSSIVEPAESADLVARAITATHIKKPAGAAAQPAPPPQKEEKPQDEGSGDDTADESEDPAAKTPEERVAKRCEWEIAKDPPWWDRKGHEDVISNHKKKAAGMLYGIEFPWSAQLLQEFGPKWLTRAFHKAGTLPKNNKVTRVMLDRNTVVDAGNNGSKFLFEVTYMRKQDFLHTQLFAKIPFDYDGPNSNDRLSSSVNKQPMDLNEINTYRVLEASMPVKTPHFYYGDISNETTNFILITERIPFAEISGKREGGLKPFEVEGPYEKCKDWMLRGSPKEYYMLAMRKQARIAGFNKAGKMGDEEFLGNQNLRPWFPDADQPEFWGANQWGSTGERPAKVLKQLEECHTFVSKTAHVLFPAYVGEEAFKQKFIDTMMKHQAYQSEITYYKHHDMDYVALGHMNLNMDNAYFWRDEEGKLDCGLLDWGGFGANSLAHKMYWSLNCSEFEDIRENLDAYIDAFIETYEETGGPRLDHDTLRTGIILTCLDNLYFMIKSVPDSKKQCPPAEWATIQDRHDPRIAKNVLGKSTLRTTLRALCNGLQIIEELKGNEVLEEWEQKFWIDKLGYEAKSREIIYGEEA